MVRVFECNYVFYFYFLKVGKVVFVAGQIGLVPHLNQLAESSVQPSLSLDHALAILKANNCSWVNCLSGVCYCTSLDVIVSAKRIWKKVNESI